RSALGESEPHTLVLLPLVKLGHVAGVLELALFTDCTEAQRELLLAVRESIVIAIEVARARVAMRKVLEESQQQAMRLREQEDMLRANYEELQAQQDELLAANTRLQRQATELEEHRRSLESNNAELQRTRRTLERKAQQLTTVSAYKSQFLANMSHELRTPLNSMIILSGLLAEHQAGVMTEKQTEYCQTIHGAATDLLSLINQVLDLAKVEAGKQAVHPEQVALHELGAYARRIFEPLAREKGLDFVVELPPEGAPAAIVTDRRKVEQILNNLLGNAIKFTQTGRVSLVIGAPPSAVELHSQARAAVALSVIDSGDGIAETHRERIFFPFEQIESSSDRRHGGTGLGLSIARELANLLQGELRLEASTEGVGSTFTCYLPQTWRASQERPRSEKQSVAVTLSPRARSSPSVLGNVLPVGSMLQASRRAMRVLIVEDDRAVADILALRLREDQIEPVAVHTAAQAMEHLALTAFSAVVLDLGLPDIDGFDLLDTLHKKYAGRLPPILVYTGRKLSDAQLSWLEDQAEVVVLKEGLAIERLVDEVRLLTRRLEDGIWQRPGSSIVVPAVRTSVAGRKLLIVDDDMRNVYALSALLRPKGAELFVADDGRDALALLDEHPEVELVLMDMMMPGLDGYETIRALRRDPRFAALPIIAVTARAMKNDRERCMLAGATDYLSKPLDPDLLLAMIGALLPLGTGSVECVDPPNGGP
ncbi:MAG TPA: response regulator, partial [Polyangiales bacterium]